MPTSLALAEDFRRFYYFTVPHAVFGLLEETVPKVHWEVLSERPKVRVAAPWAEAVCSALDRVWCPVIVCNALDVRVPPRLWSQQGLRVVPAEMEKSVGVLCALWRD